MLRSISISTGVSDAIREGGSLGAFLPRALQLLSASADAREHEEVGTSGWRTQALLQHPPPVHQGQAK